MRIVGVMMVLLCRSVGCESESDPVFFQNFLRIRLLEKVFGDSFALPSCQPHCQCGGWIGVLLANLRPSWCISPTYPCIVICIAIVTIIIAIIIKTIAVHISYLWKYLLSVVCTSNHHHPCIIVFTSETKLSFVSWCECARVCSHQQGGATLQSLSQTHSRPSPSTNHHHTIPPSTQSV